MYLSLDVEYGVLAEQNLGNGYVNAIKLSSNLEKIVDAVDYISSAVKTNIVVRSVNDLLPLNETNDINLNILRPDKNETDVYKEILSSESLFMLESSEVSRETITIGKNKISDDGNQIKSILVDYNKIIAGSNSNGIFYSLDNGKTFEKATIQGIQRVESLSVNVIKKFFGKYFAGTGETVYQSEDGKNWKQFTIKYNNSECYVNALVNDILQVKYGNRKILIAATSNGVLFATNDHSIKTPINGSSYAVTKDDKDNVYFSSNGTVYVISINKIYEYLVNSDSSELSSNISFNSFCNFGSDVLDILIKDKTLFAAVLYTVENNSRIRSITTKYGIKKAPLSDLSLQSFTSISGISQQINYLKTNGYGIYTQIKNGNYPTFWFTTDGLDFTSYQTELNDDIYEFDFIDNFTLVAGANSGIIKFKQTADYIRDKLITKIDLLANNKLLCTYINEQDSQTYTNANSYTDEKISNLSINLKDIISNKVLCIENVTLTAYELIATFNLDYISLGKNTYNNSDNKISNNVAIGNSVKVTSIGGNSIGLGQNISATGSNNIAVGNNLSTSNTNAIAIGYNLTSVPNAGLHSIAVGYDAVALCADSIAIGRMISTKTASTTKIGAAFRNDKTADNAETIALELSANIKRNGDSASKAYITTNRYTKNTGTNTGEWSEISKKEISLEGHKHLLADITDSDEKFSLYDEQINYISTYVSAIPDNVEKISVDLYSLSSQTSSISTSLCNEITALNANINRQKVTAVTALNAYTKGGASSSDTVKFPTAAAITLWADGKYALQTEINALSTQLGLVKNDILKTLGLVYEVYIAPDNTDYFIQNDKDFNDYIISNGNISAGKDSNYNSLLKIALSSIDAKAIYDYYKNEKDDDYTLHREELTSIKFLKPLKDKLDSQEPLKAITVNDIEIFRTHRLRLFPLFTLNKACEFLAKFRALGNTSYFIKCVPGKYMYNSTQNITHVDCSDTSKNALTICRIDSIITTSNEYGSPRQYATGYIDYNYNKCIEFNFYNKLIESIYTGINLILVKSYTLTYFKNIKINSGITSPEFYLFISANDNIKIRDEFIDSYPAGNTLSKNIIGNTTFYTILPYDAETLKYTVNGKNREIKLYGLYTYYNTNYFDFVYIDGCHHGFNAESRVIVYALKLFGCGVGFHTLNGNELAFCTRFVKLLKNDNNETIKIYGSCCLDIGTCMIFGYISRGSFFKFYKTNLYLDIKDVKDKFSEISSTFDNKTDNSLSCTPKFKIRGKVLCKNEPTKIISRGLFRTLINGSNDTNTVANGNLLSDVIINSFDFTDLSVLTRTTTSETVQNGFIEKSFYDNEISDNDRYLIYLSKSEGGTHLAIFYGEAFKEEFNTKLLSTNLVALKNWYYTYYKSEHYWEMYGISALPAIP